MLYTDPLKLHQHNPLGQVMPAISELPWKEHVAWNVHFGNYTITHSETFLNIHKAGYK